MVIVQTKPIQLAVVECNHIVQSGILALLNESPDIRVVGQARCGQSALEMIRGCEPDVLILDLNLSKMEGFQMVQTAREQNPDVKILALATRQNEEQVLSVLSWKIDAYCVKSAISDHLLDIIQTIHEGGAWLDPTIAGKLMHVFAKMGNRQEKPIAIRNIGLTERESRILSLIVLGKNNADIAKELFVSYHTIKSDVTNILSKLSVQDRVQAAVKALKENLV